MLYLMVLLYFAASVAAMALVLFDGPRGWLLRGSRTAAGTLAGGARHAQAVVGQARRAVRRIVGRGVRWLHEVFVVRWPLGWGAVAVLVLPALIVLGLQAPRRLAGFVHDDLVARDALVAQLLHGEQLVAPAPLPPEVFLTAEVALQRPMLASADRRWDLLEAEFRQRLLVAYRIMRERHGYEMVLIEGYRSPERQAVLQAAGSHVTNAGPFQSYHQHGLAADSAFLRDGRLVISERDPWAMRGYELYGEVAESVGLTWGGRWKLLDLGHVEWRKPGAMRRSQGNTGPPRVSLPPAADGLGAARPWVRPESAQ